VNSVGALEAIELKNQLISDGLIMHRDFEWHYSAGSWHDWPEAPATASSVVFRFQDAAMATFYSLVWVTHN